MANPFDWYSDAIHEMFGNGNKTNAAANSSFEKEYEEFIAKLKVARTLNSTQATVEEKSVETVVVPGIQTTETDAAQTVKSSKKKKTVKVEETETSKEM